MTGPMAQDNNGAEDVMLRARPSDGRLTRVQYGLANAAILVIGVGIFALARLLYGPIRDDR